MQEILLSAPFVLVYSILFGVTMKIADLLDEHGLKWFKGSAITFGILWGLFGSLLILSTPVIANVYLALIFAFILRYRIDYLNHGIAATIILMTFLLSQTVLWNTFLFFFATFSVFGLAHDYFENKKKPNNSVLKTLKTLIDFRCQYYIFPLIYSVYTGFWLVFPVVALNMLFYEITTKIGIKSIRKQKRDKK